MKRLSKIKKESNENLNNQVNVPSHANGNGNGLTEIQQVAEEKAAATLFPLNLISNKFKNPQPDALKGKIN